jgi:hypothetical protein
MTEAARTERDGMTVLAAAIVVAMPLGLFREFVGSNQVWIGNPDRLNAGLKIMLFWIRGIADGHLHAWNEHELLGYDSFAFQYTFPNPLTWFVAAFGPPHILVVAGWLTVVFLVLAGMATLAFLRSLQCSWLAALVGASCYQLCALTILKVSQYDVSFVIFILIPVVLALIHEVRDAGCPWLFAGLVTTFVFILLMESLDHAKYALPLFGAYAAWRSWRMRQWAPVVVTAATIGIALVVASPRLLGLIGSLNQYSRIAPGNDLNTFNGIYEFQNIRPHEIVRWLDGTIFGISSSDAFRLHNNINLSEGFLLSISAAIPVLLLATLPRFQGRWVGLLRIQQQDIAFWSWTLLLSILVVVSKPLTHGFYLLFLRMDFVHARILLIGLPAIAAMVTIILCRCSPGGGLKWQVTGLALGVVAAIAIEHVARQSTGATFFEWFGMNLRHDALLRAAMTIVLAGLLVITMLMARLNPATIGHAALGGLIVTQAFLAADLQVNGPQTRGEQPFYRGDMYMAKAGEFDAPTPQQIGALRAKTHDKRVVLICPPESAGGFCAGHLAEAWQLRTVDGYYGLGLPDRIRKLPWGKAEGLRSISFTSSQDLPWPLLGLLNVGKALVVNNEFYKNRATSGERADVSHIEMRDNPEAVVPRAFLAGSAEPVADAAQAVQRLFSGNRPQDVQTHSYVEGLTGVQTFSAREPVAVSGFGDHLEFDVSSTMGPRLLVVNELFMPGWRAFVDSVETAVLPANVVMRAVVLPPTAKRVVMEYQPFVRTRGARLLFGLGALLTVCGLALTALGDRRVRAFSKAPNLQ